MYPIVRREKLADKIYLMDVKAPRVAQYCEPGQFVIVKIDASVFRLPFVIMTGKQVRSRSYSRLSEHLQSVWHIYRKEMHSRIL